MNSPERKNGRLSKKALAAGAGILAVSASVGALAILELIDNGGTDRQSPPHSQEQSGIANEEIIFYWENRQSNNLSTDRVTLPKPPITRQIK
jgi:hypothetical protein